jgi:Zn-dependent protease with chaperone function
MFYSATQLTIEIQFCGKGTLGVARISGENQMEQGKFDALVQQLESFAYQQPSQYKVRVGALAVLGYAYIALILFGLIGLFVLLLWMIWASGRVHRGMVQFMLLLLVPICVVVRSLFVSIPKPTGVELKRTQVPALFSVINDLCKQLVAPKFDHVLLTQEFNAAVVQVPRLGFLGWYKHYLILGLPLMQALSVDQLRAVIAHELGHISGNHSRFSGWIYRQRISWYQMFDSLQHSESQAVFSIFAKFFNWYAPYFSAYSFVLCRQNEYEADHCAAQLVGAKRMAEALVTVEARARLAGTYWDGIYQRSIHEVEPPAIAFTNLLSTVKSELPPTSSDWLQEAFAQTTNNADTHPCLSDRLAALGFKGDRRFEITVPPLSSSSAAEKLLGNVFQTFMQQFDQDWKVAIETPWRQRFAYAQEIKELEVKEYWTTEEAWQLAHWSLEQDDIPVAMERLQVCIQRDPNHVAANFIYGKFLLEAGDQTGIFHLEKAAEQNPDCRAGAIALIELFRQNHPACSS